MNNNRFFIAIGPPKTATSWLYKSLKQHPEVFLPEDKEIRYFWSREFLGKGNLISKLFGKHWHYKGKRRYLKSRMKYHIRGLAGGKLKLPDVWWDVRYFFMTENDQWYSTLFDKNKLSGDITPKYSELPESVISRISTLYPNAKIIVSLRSPVDREWSRAKMNLMKKKGIDHYAKVDASLFRQEFNDELQHQANDYVNLVKRWKKYFPEQNVLVFFYEELVDDPNKLLNKVCDFLSIQPVEFKEAGTKVNQGIEQEIPYDFKKLLVDLNYPFIIKMPEYFDSVYPVRWLEDCAKTRDENG